MRLGEAPSQQIMVPCIHVFWPFVVFHAFPVGLLDAKARGACYLKEHKIDTQFLSQQNVLCFFGRMLVLYLMKIIIMSFKLISLCYNCICYWNFLSVAQNYLPEYELQFLQTKKL